MTEPMIREDREVHTKPEIVPGRDYTIYTRELDAAAVAKKERIDPYLGDLPEGSVVADIGSGTGAVAELLAEAHHGVKVIAIDKSHELLELADKQPLIHLVFDDARSLSKMPDNSVDVAICSTTGHEIFSKYGKEGLQKTLEAAFRILKPGGRLIWVDMLKPSYTGNVFLRIDVHDGLDSVEKATIDGVLDYSKLSTRALFDRFHQEFQGGNAFSYRSEIIDGKEHLNLPAQYAQEFNLHKDYTANFPSEAKETYLYWTLEDPQVAFAKVGFTNITVMRHDNEWIRTIRLRGKTPLFIRDEKGVLHEVEFATHFVVKAEKPRNGVVEPRATIATVDYQKLLDTVIIDEENDIVRVGDRQFKIERYIGQGAHKKVYKIREPGKGMLLKVVRKDEKDVHNVFKAMTQANRQEVLTEYQVPAMPIVEFDPSGPPYRYLLQEELPLGSVYAVDLLRNGELTERDVFQMAEIINRFETKKEWQLDLSPFNWARVTDEKGETRMVYTGSTVYAYDERWTFPIVGLLQWIDPQYLPDGENRTALIPEKPVVREFLKTLATNRDPKVVWWKTHLSPAVLSLGELLRLLKEEV